MHRLAIQVYTVMFGLANVIVIGIIMNSHRDEMIDWLKSQQQESFAYATELPQRAITTFNPVVEEIPLKSSVQLDAPIIRQYPELPRGCEVTSLAMLLQYNNVPTDKMELAKKIKKDDTEFVRTKHGVFFGNPAKGFVGDMYSLSNPGYGVYHQPIAQLAKKYLGDSIVDFSGGTFFEILQHLNHGQPVWVITNSTYQQLPDSQFETWQTEDGPVRITMKEHSVLVTGYDQNYVYFNDPLSGQAKKAPMKEFQGAWEQMGKQAITVKP